MERSDIKIVQTEDKTKLIKIYFYCYGAASLDKRSEEKRVVYFLTQVFSPLFHLLLFHRCSLLSSSYVSP